MDRAPELLHGKTSLVHHHGEGVLAGLPDPFTATRYHSLAIDPSTVPAELEVTARTDSGVIMAVRHRTLAVEGVQFHPESVLTESGAERDNVGLQFLTIRRYLSLVFATLVTLLLVLAIWS